MKSLKAAKAELLANPAVRQAYDEQAPEFEQARKVSLMLIAVDYLKLGSIGGRLNASLK